MASSDATFPDDIEALKALLIAREAALREHEGELTGLRDTVTMLLKTLSDRALEIEQLELRLEDLRADDGEAMADTPTRSR